MKKTIKFEIWFILICLLFIPVFIQSTSLGSFTRMNSAKVNAGDKVRFEVLFWNLGDPYKLVISEKNIPSDWKVSITPNNFLLDMVKSEKPPFGDGDYINLPNIGTIKPQRVRIDIKTSSNTKRGYYDVLFVASTMDSNEGISVSQHRDISFVINILDDEDLEEIIDEEDDLQKEGFLQSQNDIDSEIIQENNNKPIERDLKEEINEQKEQNKNPLTGRIINTLSNALKNQKILILFGTIFIILGCVVIYKYA